MLRVEGMAYCKYWCGQTNQGAEKGFEQHLNTFGLDHGIPRKFQCESFEVDRGAEHTPLRTLYIQFRTF